MWNSICTAKFHYYLSGHRFTLYTDHRPLTYINDQAELPQTVADWRDILLSYDFECVYRPVVLNVIPDALSRAFVSELLPPLADPEPKATKAKKILSALLDGQPIHRTEVEDAVMSDDFENLSMQLTRNVNPTKAYMHVIQDEDTQRDTVLEEDKRCQLMQAVHELGHVGSAAMVAAIHKRDTLGRISSETAWIGFVSASNASNLILHARVTILLQPYMLSCLENT